MPAILRGDGRPGLPPGRYFRSLLIGYFEGLDAERAIAWRAADSFALRDFLGLVLPEAPPDHSRFGDAPLDRYRDARLPGTIHFRDSTANRPPSASANAIVRNVQLRSKCVISPERQTVTTAPAMTP